MSRRDTIIIAVLLNAGLLVVLFATSLKSDKSESEPSAITVLASNLNEVKESAPMATLHVVAPPAHDQVDKVIEHYVTPQVANNADQTPNFLADLHATG